MTGIPSFDALAASEIAQNLPAEFAIYHKADARKYIKKRNDFIAFVLRTVLRSDLTNDQKIAAIEMGKFFYERA